jgi:hypothetical protein
LAENFIAAGVVAPGKAVGSPSLMQAKYESLLKYMEEQEPLLFALGYPSVSLRVWHVFL